VETVSPDDLLVFELEEVPNLDAARDALMQRGSLGLLGRDRNRRSLSHCSVLDWGSSVSRKGDAWLKQNPPRVEYTNTHDAPESFDSLIIRRSSIPLQQASKQTDVRIFFSSHYSSSCCLLSFPSGPTL
jgi:hypothetical protein